MTTAHRTGTGVVLLLALVGSWARAGSTTRVSVASDASQANQSCGSSSMSADGRLVAFESMASNLVPGDTNNCWDVFVHDRQTGATTRVSVASDGSQGNAESRHPSISADGRYVAFDSLASNLVAGDTNARRDVFLHDRQTGATSRVNVASDGTQAEGYSGWPGLSADGRYVVFESGAPNLTPGDANERLDVFLHDRQAAQTTRVSVASDGTQGNGDSQAASLSADGRYVAFRSDAANLVPGDTNGEGDVFVRDRQGGTTTRASVDSAGNQGLSVSSQPSVSADGRYVAFASGSNLGVQSANAGGGGPVTVLPVSALDLRPSGYRHPRADHVWVHDRLTGETRCVSVTSDGAPQPRRSYGPRIGGDGRYVAFSSCARQLVPGDTNWHLDAFVHDCQTGETRRVSVATSGAEGESWSEASSISADGRYATLRSAARNLVAGDTNGTTDVFVRQRWGDALLQPDMLVRTPTWIGDGTYNDTGEGQTAQRLVGAGRKAIYYLRVENDGSQTDQLRLWGSPGPPRWEVRYFSRVDGGTDVTARITGLGWVPGVMGTDGQRFFRVEVTPPDGAAPGKRLEVSVGATSEGDERQHDRVRLITCVEQAPAGVVLTAVSAAPTRAGAQLLFRLSAQADVSVTIRNLAGRPIRTVCRDRPCEVGANRLLWNARSDQAVRVPSGTYIVQVEARGAGGAMQRGLAALRLRR
jgi:Tol biopolymer transport system component